MSSCVAEAGPKEAWLRYQFQDFPQCGLYNSQGLPVLPFRHPILYTVSATRNGLRT